MALQGQEQGMSKGRGERVTRGSGRNSAGTVADRKVGGRAHALGDPSRVLRSSLLVALFLAIGGLLLSSAPALASGAVEHVFGHAFKAKGGCVFTEPGAVAANDATGEVYVFDRAKNAFDRFSSDGHCNNFHKVGKAETGEVGNEGMAVDNSPTSPSSGDLYVVDAEEKAILKFRLEGTTLLPAGKIKIFKEKPKVKGEETEEHEFEEIRGLSVDSNGDLWVFQGEKIDRFGNEKVNTFLSQVEEVYSPSGCSNRPGFAVALNDAATEVESFYVGRERENRLEECEAEATTAVKLNSAGQPAAEPARNAQIDNENTTGVALDGSNDVYFDNGTSIAAFSPTGSFIQRFGNEPGQGQLKEANGIAVGPATNDVYVADSEAEVKVYVPKPPASIEPPTAGQELPDQRAWELVSPPNKLGSEIYGLTQEKGVVQASADGSAITYSSSSPIVAAAPSNRAPEPVTNISRRGTEGWSTQDVATPRSEQVPGGYQVGNGAEYRYFSSDLSVAFLEPDQGVSVPEEPPLSPEAKETTLYSRTQAAPGEACEPTPSTCYQALVSPADDTTGVKFGAQLEFVTAAPDGRHAVLSSKSNSWLTPEAVELGEEEGFYEWEAGGSLQLVNVLPKGEEGTAAGARIGASVVNQGNTRHAISNDGSSVIWSAGEGPESKLYLHDRLSAGKAVTVRVDKAQGVEEPAEDGALFATASAEGTTTGSAVGMKIVFTDPQRLTPNSTAQEGVEETEGLGDLYVCEVVEAEAGKPACKLTDLTAGVAAANESAAVQGVLGASEDGSYVYFVADGALAPDAGRQTCNAGPNICNLYVEHFNGKAWETPRVIAVLSGEDQHDWQHEATEGGGNLLAGTTSRVSPDGQYLAFMSDRPLTGYDNTDVNEKTGPHADEEVFLYDAQTNRVLCASCNPQIDPKTKEPKRPAGIFDTEKSGEGIGLVSDRPETWKQRWLAANVPGWTGLTAFRALYQSRYLSDSGRLFFNSTDPLVPAATNGKADVYEYEPKGVGSCESATGCIALISSGTSKQESSFLDASENGNDVFFLTSERLVTQDQDSAFDVYDAHACTTSSPCITPPSAEPGSKCAQEASESACRAPVSSEPALPPVPPSAEPGSGNVGSLQVLGVTEGKAPVVKPKAKPLTRAQLLAKARKACKKDKKKSKRIVCEKQARKRYGPLKKKGKK
jgi:hypothetical protein